MKTHKKVKPLRINGIKPHKRRYTVCLDPEIDDLLCAQAQAEDRRPAALLAIFAKRELLPIQEK